jgi:hypothetical protein
MTPGQLFAATVGVFLVRGEKAILAARACADEHDCGDFIYESTDGLGNWRFVAEDGTEFAVRPVLAGETFDEDDDEPDPTEHDRKYDAWKDGGR